MGQVDGRKEDDLTRGGLADEPRLATPRVAKALNMQEQGPVTARSQMKA